RGFRDVMGADARAMALVEERARLLMRRYNIGEIRTPVLESVQLFQRTAGETSDLVEKQIYAFTDRDEAETVVALRPEGTASVVRAYIDAGLDRSDPEQRYFYTGPVFRRERPQKGRYRQHYQFGVEIFGRPDATCDAELLILLDDLRRDLGLTLSFEINSIGDAACRPAFRQAVLDFGLAHEQQLCDDCKRRIRQNPLRLLDCKTDAALVESAPKSIDYLCEPCRGHYDTVKSLLNAADVAFVENYRLVRGLDYYSRTTFEVKSADLGAQSTVSGGGRYDGFVEMLGGAPVAGIGFGIGIDRMALALQAARPVDTLSPDVTMVALGDAALVHATRLARNLRAENVTVEVLSPGRKMKALLTRASKIGARFAVILGDDELARGVAQLRNLKQSQQSEVPISDLARAIKTA
ncbi:MAG TPA: histidine--tRNA ligase, partial [Candidatus Binataceae bacterium]|nr:histidine--tRNA ligase [Candidatus Binataceae bacterium]